jgi:hypothetical protein
MADKIAENKIDCRNYRSSRSRPRPGATSVAADQMMMEVVVVCESYRAVQVWRQ